MKYIKTILIYFFLISITIDAQNIITPQKFFGFLPGSDKNLINYEQLIDYLKVLEKNSNKIKLTEIGKSTLGKPLYIAFISSEKNINNLNELKKINKELALNYNLSDNELKKYIKKGKVFFIATLSMHSNEVGPSQAAPIIAYNLITDTSSLTQNILDNVVYMMIPCHNPDGMDMIVEHYYKYKNTKYDGCSMPGLYHKYVGHDNNRDFVILTQKETKAISAIWSKDWFPQVMIEKHQMGMTGPRYFVPPMHDPIAENIDETLWNWTWVFGSNMVKDMTATGLAGVCQHYLFDDYWPGSTETCMWKGVIAMLTEAASVKYASPVFIEQNELSVIGKGISEYKKSINMPLPWEGGWWRLSDIVTYEWVSTYSILKTCYKRKEEILKFRNELCKKEINKGTSQAPYLYIFPKKQKDKSELIAFLHLLDQHGISFYKLNKDINFNDTLFQKGDIIIPLAQPFRSFIKEIIEPQEYPIRHYTPNGKIIKPYDITSWSIPLQNGIKYYSINHNPEYFKNSYSPFNILDLYNKQIENSPYILLPASNNGSYKAIFFALNKNFTVYRNTQTGDFIIKSPDTKLIKYLSQKCFIDITYIKNFKLDKKYEKLTYPKIALIETIFHDMDAGWTRFILDEYNIKYNTYKPADLIKANLNQYDIIIIPDSRKDLLLYGKYRSKNGVYHTPNYPPQLLKGMGEKGLNNLIKFVENGGTIVSWGKSTELFSNTIKINKEEIKLPYSEISSILQKKGLFIPGALLKVKLIKNNKLVYGLDEIINVFYKGNGLFQTSIPYFDTDRKVIGIFPEKNILVSGYGENLNLLANKSVFITVKKGKGTFILIGFNPQFRASTHSTYKIIFNSLLY